MSKTLISFIFSILFSITVPKIYAKDSTNVSSNQTIPLISVHIGYQIPSFNLQRTYGNNYNIGGAFTLKTKSNWVIDIRGGFLWGGILKDKDQVLSKIADQNGFVIDNNGDNNSIITESRGFSGFISLGRFFAIKQSEKHYILLSAGGGVLSHYTSFAFNGLIPQLSGDYQKGYDRLSLGPAAHARVSYYFLHPLNHINFYAGIDYTIGAVQNIRRFNYFSMQEEKGYKANGLLGGHIGISIKLKSNKYQEEKGEYYYY